MTLMNAFEDLATEGTLEEQNELLRRIIALLMSPRGYDKSLARNRVTAAVESLPTLALCLSKQHIAACGERCFNAHKPLKQNILGINA